MPKRLSVEVEREVLRLAAQGHTQRAIGALIGHGKHAVANVLLRARRPPIKTEWNPSAARLSLREREEIRVGLERAEAVREARGHEHLLAALGRERHRDMAPEARRAAPLRLRCHGRSQTAISRVP